MKTAYTVDIHGTEYICITPKAHHEKRIFRIAMNYKEPVFKSNVDNLLFFDACKRITDPYKIVGYLEPITEWDEKYGIDYREFHSIKQLYFLARANEEKEP